MEARELKIGNLVKGIGHKITWEVEGIDKEFIFTSQNWRLLSSFKPIPLTKKWLFKLGFEYNEYYENYKIKANEYYNSVKLDDGIWCYNNDSSDAGCYFVAEIQYVHQLQNLYFALNQKELVYGS